MRDGDGRWATVRDGGAERNVRALQILRILQISDLEFNTPSALRAGGFNRFAHSAGPGLKVKEMFKTNYKKEIQRSVEFLSQCLNIFQAINYNRLLMNNCFRILHAWWGQAPGRI